MSVFLQGMLYRIAAFVFPDKAAKIPATGHSETGAVQTKTGLTPAPDFNKQFNIPAWEAHKAAPVLYVQPLPKGPGHITLIAKPPAVIKTITAYFQTAKNMIMKARITRYLPLTAFILVSLLFGNSCFQALFPRLDLT